MNPTYAKHHAAFLSAIRLELLYRLGGLPEGWQRKFKLMYAQPTDDRARRKIKDFGAHVDAITIEQCVADMDPEKMEWAMTQLDNSIKKMEDTP